MVWQTTRPYLRCFDLKLAQQTVTPLSPPLVAVQPHSSILIHAATASSRRRCPRPKLGGSTSTPCPISSSHLMRTTAIQARLAMVTSSTAPPSGLHRTATSSSLEVHANEMAYGGGLPSTGTGACGRGIWVHLPHPSQRPIDHPPRPPMAPWRDAIVYVSRARIRAMPSSLSTETSSYGSWNPHREVAVCVVLKCANITDHPHFGAPFSAQPREAPICCAVVYTIWYCSLNQFFHRWEKMD
jgi:hypothetical protein